LKLQTEISLTPQQPAIDYNSKVVLMGSCFVEHIGDAFAYYKFEHLQNPFGILFHPVAIETLVTRAINKTYFGEQDVFYDNEHWHCFEVHSLINASEKQTLLQQLNDSLDQLHDYLLQATHLMFTYGTAWVYRHIESDTIVTNCHKIPQKKFLKELLTPDEVAATIENTIALIKDVNPTVNFIHTVSPVRHIKDGFVENGKSKANLISGVHQLIEARKRVHYFPSYEIIMDQLRDYRFYKEDMIHPNSTATKIVWELFSEVWISSEVKELQKEIDAIQSGLEHKPFNPSSEAHQLFLSELDKKIAAVREKLPHITFM